jgi:hypothetical protein
MNIGGIPTLITTTTASNATNVAFTSGLSATYFKYMFVFTDIGPATDSNTLTMNFSTDGGSNYNLAKTSTFFRAQHNGSSSDLGYQSGNDLDNSTAYQVISADLGNGADESTSGVLYLWSPSNTTFVKNWTSRFNCHHASDYSNDMFSAGMSNTTVDIDAIDFKMSSGNFDGVIQMYGIA